MAIMAIGNSWCHLLVSVTALVEALKTIRIGVLSDRLIVTGKLALNAIRTYPRDVATAAESYRRQPMTEVS
jgi:hypothetical protein